MIYITGDKHGYYWSIHRFVKQTKTTLEDILIILGDAGINYYLNSNDIELKKELADLPITFFCIHGNHEERPENIDGYKLQTFHQGLVYFEEEYPNILFAKDAEIYDFDNKQTLVIGGAYSVDKYYRIQMGSPWYESEQPSLETKDKVRQVLNKRNNKIDIILSHTCPYKYLPREMFIEGIDQKVIDNSTEYFLDEIEEVTDYQKWYCDIKKPYYKVFI